MVSQNFRESAYNPDTDDVWLVLARLQHDDLQEDITVVNDLSDIISNGVLYHACPFEVILPDDTDDGPPAARVRIDNVSQEVVKSLREINTPLNVRFQVVLASNPDVVEIEYGGLSLRNVTANIATITGVVGLDDLRLEVFPVHQFGPTHFRSLF